MQEIALVHVVCIVFRAVRSLFLISFLPYFHDIPLLFETGAEKRMDYTVCVSAPYHIQRRRVLSRPGMSEDKFHSILETQMPDHEKVQRADFVVKTGMGMAHSYRQLANIVREVR